MSLLARYAARRFLSPFFFGLGVFALIVFLADLFDKLNRLMGTKAPAWVVAEYLALSMPYWTIRVLPMAVLLATIFSVTGFMRTGEFIGLQASGVRPRRFFQPLLAAALAISGAAFVLQETFLPFCYRRASRLWAERIHSEWYRDSVLIAGPNRFVTTELFNPRDGSMERPVMDVYGRGELKRQVDARSARWDARRGRWIFENGVVRAFGPGGVLESQRSFNSEASDLDLAPVDLTPQPADPEAMSIRQLRTSLRHCERLSEPLGRLRTALQAKLAYPLTNLILCALGIPIALRLGMAGRAVSFVAALAVCFLYLWFIETGRSLGSAGRLSPALAAWLPHAIFAAAAFALRR
jgi:lipopolysaccharide export system permease protein